PSCPSCASWWHDIYFLFSNLESAKNSRKPRKQPAHIFFIGARRAPKTASSLMFKYASWFPPWLIFPCILGNDYVEECGSGLFKRAFQRRLDGLRLFHPLTKNAEGLRQPREIYLRTDDLRSHLGSNSDVLLGPAELILHRHVRSVVKHDH